MAGPRRMNADDAAPTDGPGSYAGHLVSSNARVLDPAGLGDHVDRLYRAAWAMCGSREDAEDLVQDTFARVLAKPRLLRNDDDLGYLLRVLRNTFVSRHRAAMRRPQSTPMPEELEPVDPSGATRPDAAVEAREVFAYIAALPESFRDALIAVDVVGLSYGEAAKALGTKEATITSRLYRARAQVARGMDPSHQGVL
jgi:RNA polymerase sigma-70 factor, ECF subfamily